MSRPTLLALPVALSLAAACERAPNDPSIDEVRSKEGAIIAPKLAALRDAVVGSESLPALRPIADVGEPLVVAGIRWNDEADKLGANAAWVYEEDLAFAARNGFDVTRIRTAKHISRCLYAYEKGAFVPQDDKAEPAPGRYAKWVFENCSKIRYALVISPSERADAEKDHRTRTFSGGYAKGELRVYRFDTGEYLGGFRYSSGLGAEVNANENTDASLTHEIERTLEKELKRALPDTVIVI